MVYVDIYTRLSRDPGGQTATARQEKDARTYADLRGWKVGQVFTDVDLSAYRRGVQRPGYEALLQRVRGRTTDGVLVWKLDRLVRRAAEFERFWTVAEDAGAFLASVNEPIDTTTDLGLVIVRVLVAFAQLESATMSLRIRSAKEAAARAGRPSRNGRRPYGLSADWAQIIPSEEARVKEAAARVLAGEPLRSICLDWNAKGVPAPYAKFWNGTSLRKLLLDPRVEGVRTFRGEVIGEGSWPPLLDHDTAAAVRTLLTDPSRRAPSRGTPGLLTGLLRCGRCGAGMQLGIHSNGNRRYVCPGRPYGCSGTSIVADPCEEVVVAWAADWAADADTQAAYTLPADLAPLLAEIERLERQDGQLTHDHYVEQLVARPQFLAAHRTLERKMGEARRRYSEARKGHALSTIDVDLFDRWERLEPHMRRAMLEACIDRIEVRSQGRGAARFDPSRLQIVPN